MNPLLPTFERLSELKRLPSSRGAGSVAAVLFGWAAARLAAAATRAEESAACNEMAAAACAAAVAGDATDEALAAIGLDRWQDLQARALAACIPHPRPRGIDLLVPVHAPAWGGEVPGWIARLRDTPRAGYTTAGRPKCLPWPRETQGEHSLVAAVYAVLLAHDRGIDPITPCWLALFHHVPSVLLPHLDHEVEQLMGLAAARALERDALTHFLARIPAVPAARLQALLIDGALPEPCLRIVQDADVIDRALQVRAYERVAALTVERAIHEYALLNAPPLEKVQAATLTEFGILEKL